MVWKCPKCSHTSTSHKAMMKHYYAKHYTAKSKAVSKGKAKKKFTFHPPKRRR